MSQNGTEFQYALTRRNALLVAAFSGRLNASALEALVRCRGEITTDHLDAKAIVIDFQGVSDVALEAIPELAQIQKLIRTKEIELRLSSLAKDLAEKLEKRGVIRKTELAQNLSHALAMLTKILKNASAVAADKIKSAS